jgi:hypothetical protein
MAIFPITINFSESSGVGGGYLYFRNIDKTKVKEYNPISMAYTKEIGEGDNGTDSAF